MSSSGSEWWVGRRRWRWLLSAAVNGIGETFLILAGIAAIVFTFPWQRLSALRAGPFELSLEQGQIKGAVDSILIGGTEKQQLTGILSRLAPDIERARGSRVLWVDDKPTRVCGERRLFRALGIETVSVPSSREAVQTLRRDNDFDLVITSLFKTTESDRIPDDDRRLPGVVFVQSLRGEMDLAIETLTGCDRAINDRVINNVAVIFYVAAFSMSELREKTHAAAIAKRGPGVEVSGNLNDLLTKAVRLLADVRAHPIEVPVKKKASSN